ncbi:MAG: signal peptidase I [Rickettsiales bacterium]|nr:signal peptidase I [Rickettsiales bacterium]
MFGELKNYFLEKTKIYKGKYEEKHKKDNEEKNKEDVGTSTYNETITSVLWALLLVTIIRSFLYEPFHIPSGSMKPGLVEGDYILVSKFEYGYTRYSIPFGIPIIKERIFDFKKPKRGEVVVFRLPSSPNINYIKRLIGLPGDKITVKNKVLYVNDEEIKREFIDMYVDEKNHNNLQRYRENFFEKKIDILQNAKIPAINGDGEFIVPENQYFFMGDNRDNSLDSRFVDTGYIPYQNIVGRAKIIFFSKSDSIFKIWKIRFKRIFKIIK